MRFLFVKNTRSVISKVFLLKIRACFVKFSLEFKHEKPLYFAYFFINIPDSLYFLQLKEEFSLDFNIMIHASNDPDSIFQIFIYSFSIFYVFFYVSSAYLLIFIY